MVAEEDIDIGEIVAEYGLACHLEELDEVGLTVVDQDTLRLPDAWVDHYGTQFCELARPAQTLNSNCTKILRKRSPVAQARSVI